MLHEQRQALSTESPLLSYDEKLEPLSQTACHSSLAAAEHQRICLD